MAWSTPATYTSGSVLTAAQMNAISANLNETAPAKATKSTTYFVGNGANAIQEREFNIARTTASETTVSTGYVELTSTQRITYTSGPLALVLLTAQMLVNTAGEIGLHSVIVSGASTIASDDSNALVQQSATINSRIRATAAVLLTTSQGLLGGSNLYKATFRVTAGQLTAANREMVIMAL
jgi:hypothetical protein